MNEFENRVSETIRRLQLKYSRELREKASSFISLGIENQCDLLLHDEHAHKTITIEDLCDNMLNSETNMISLLGGPGAGKSTLLLKLANMLSANSNKYIPVLIKCGLEEQDEIKKLVHIGNYTDEEKEYLWQKGRLFLIFDGINEVSNVDIKVFLNKIRLLSEDYTECKYIVSCRSLEYPLFEYSPFEKYTVTPVTENQIREKLIMELGKEKGEHYFSELCHSPKNYLLDICRTPLLLSLIITILLNSSKATSLEELKSKSDIYKSFYDSITRRQRKKSTVPSADKFYGLRDEIFKQLSYYMQAKGIVYIEEKDLEDFIRNAYYLQNRSKDIIKNLQNGEDGHSWYSAVVDELKKSGFFNVYNVLDDSANTFAFIHQSFQEYFAGCFLSDSNRISETKFTTYLLQNGTFENQASQSRDTKRNWATIEFATNQDASNRLISYVMRYSQKRMDPNSLELAAFCILQDAYHDKSLVDDCCIWLLEAFKYWSIPYKYNLIYAANRLLSYVSDDFPERLKNDIEYFGKKYTGGYNPIEYPESFDIEFLQRMIRGKDLEHALNAIFTMGERIWPEENAKNIFEYLFSLLSSGNQAIREQAVKAIKGVIEHNEKLSIDDDKLKILLKIINNKNESGAIRTYTLNTIATTGDHRAIPIFMKYLEDKENPYRDSASWSLQELILNSSTQEYSMEYMKKFYFQCLIRESDDETGMYSKGNLVYTLSKLNAKEYVKDLKKWLVNEHEPYVQEDGINAIGVLAGKNETNFIDQYSVSSDPVIRAKALKSLLDIDRDYYWDRKKEVIKKDRYSIVSSIADEDSFLVSESIDELLKINPENNKIYDQYYKYVGTVKNYNM